MKKIFTLLILSTIFLTNLYSQSISPEWAERFNSGESAFDFPTNMAVDSAGNVYVTGKSWGEGTDYDYSTIKYNTSGVFQWEARYNGPGNYIDEPTGIVVDKNGNVYVTGFSYGGSSDYDYATIKYNSNGVQQWVDRYNGTLDSTDQANSIAVDSSGNIYVSGESLKYLTIFSYEIITVKYNSSGNRLWINSFKYLPNSYDHSLTMKLDNSGNVYIGGYTTENLNSNAYLFHIVKYNSSGYQLWITTYQINYLLTYSLVVDGVGNSFITLFATYSTGIIIIKYNSSGIQQWIRETTYPQLNETISAIDNTGNYYLLSRSHDNISYNYVTFKYNTFGNLQWMQIYNGAGNLEDKPNSIAIDISGNVYVTGHSSFPSTSSDYLTVKYNSSGIKQWISRYNGSINYDEPKAISLDYSGNVYVTGSSIGLLTEYDYLTLKYPSSLQLNANISLEGFYNGSTNSLNKKDTITAYIRNTFYPYALIDSGKAVIDTNTFRCGFCFNHAATGTYYITIKHRNSLETWSKDGGEVFLKSSPTYYDFTTNSTQAFGNNLKLKGSKYCLYSGDINQDGFITSLDALKIYNDLVNFISGNYLSTDLNGDGVVDLSDKTICYNNSINFVSVIRP